MKSTTASKIAKRPHMLYTLKSRMIFVLLLNTIVLLAFIGIVSYYAIVSIFENKIQSGVKSNMKQMVFSLENELDSLYRAAQQLSFEGGIAEKLEQFLTTSDTYEKFQLEKNIQTYINSITYMNPNIGLIEYYYTDTKQSAISTSIMSTLML